MTSAFYVAGSGCEQDLARPAKKHSLPITFRTENLFETLGGPVDLQAGT